MKRLRIRVRRRGARNGCASPRCAGDRPGRRRCASPPATTTSSFARLIDAASAGRAAARAPARLRAAARAPARPVAHRSAARRSVERPRLRASGRARTSRASSSSATASSSIRPRPAQFKGELVRVVFQLPAPPGQKRGAPDTAAGAGGPRAATRDREEGHRTDHARRAAADGAHRRRAREAPAGGA